MISIHRVTAMNTTIFECIVFCFFCPPLLIPSSLFGCSVKSFLTSAVHLNCSYTFLLSDLRQPLRPHAKVTVTQKSPPSPRPHPLLCATSGGNWIAQCRAPLRHVTCTKQPASPAYLHSNSFKCLPPPACTCMCVRVCV